MMDIMTPSHPLWDEFIERLDEVAEERMEAHWNN